MEFVTDQLALFGLNEREIRVFTALVAFGQMNMATLAKRARMPRTTADAIIRRLEKQGIIEPVTVKKHTEWYVDLPRVRAKLTTLEYKLVREEDKQNDEKTVKKISRAQLDRLIAGQKHGYVCMLYVTPDSVVLTDTKKELCLQIARKDVAQALEAYFSEK